MMSIIGHIFENDQSSVKSMNAVALTDHMYGEGGIVRRKL
jgi:hypothetical protein